MVDLAAAVGVRLIVESPVRTITTNVHGTEVVLEAAARKQKLVILASTSEVYGKSPRTPFREDDDLGRVATTQSRGADAGSKALEEWLGLAYMRERNVPVMIVRCFNTVGPRQPGRYGMVIPTFVRQALMSEPITVYGDGQQRRSFTYVGDVVEALTRLVVEPAAIGQVFNIGNVEEISILALAERIKSMAASRSEIVLVPYEEAYEAGFEDMPRRVPSLDKIHRLVGYRPPVALEAILPRELATERAGAALANRR